MAFLDETGLAYFWQQILVKLNSYIPSTRKINNKTLANDINLTASDIGALPDTYIPPNQTAQQVGADPAGTAASAVSQHNTDATSHNDLRLALKGLTDRINAALDSDDTTLDQMSEVVAYIKSNKSMIDAITTSKVSVADIVNNLTTNVSNKPLSAAQGVALKELIDALSNDKLDAAELTNAVNTALAQAKESGDFDGADGHTPVKGTDYWTASDKAEIVAETASAIDLTSYAKKTELPTKTSQLKNDSGFLTRHQDISGKQDKSTLEADVAAKGFTKNTGTYSKPAGGIPKSDLATAVQTSLGKADSALQSVPSTYRTASEQDTIDSGKVDKVTGKGLSSNDYTDAAKAKVDAIPANPKYTDTVYDDTALKERVATIEGKESAWDAKSDFSGSYNDLTDKPTIPAPVTEQTVSGWGFTKNTGTYSKPTGGIPKADLANNVQASLNKADTALQEHQSLAAYRTSAAQDIIDKGKQDKITSTNKLAYSLISDTPTIPTVPSALKNPHAITFTGASTGTYDGSSALTINIPESGADTYTQFTQVVISLPLSSWTGSSTFTNTIAISSVKADTIVIASPAPSDKDAFAFSNVYCSAQAEGSLTFTAKTKPATDLTANLIIVTLPEGATAAANTCSLTVAGWSSNTQTVSLTGMAADRIVIIGPVADSIDVCKTNAVYCSAQGNGTLTFKCQTTPNVAITMNVIMI